MPQAVVHCSDKDDKVGDVEVSVSEKKRTVRDIPDKPGKWNTTPLYSPKRANRRSNAERGFAAIGRGSQLFTCVLWNRRLRRLAESRPTTAHSDDCGQICAGRARSAAGHNIRMLRLRTVLLMDPHERLPYENHGNRRENIRILGNGVCPPVMKAIVEQIEQATDDGGYGSIRQSVRRPDIQCLCCAC